MSSSWNIRKEKQLTTAITEASFSKLSCPCSYSYWKKRKYVSACTCPCCYHLLTDTVPSVTQENSLASVVYTEQCIFSNYEQFLLLTSGVWKGVCVFIYFGEHCEMVHEFFVRVLHSTGVLCSSNRNVISCSWKLKSFYSSSSWSYSSMLQVALNKLQYIIQVS